MDTEQIHDVKKTADDKKVVVSPMIRLFQAVLIIAALALATVGIYKISTISDGGPDGVAVMAEKSDASMASDTTTSATGANPTPNPADPCKGLSGDEFGTCVMTQVKGLRPGGFFTDQEWSVVVATFEGGIETVFRGAAKGRNVDEKFELALKECVYEFVDKTGDEDQGLECQRAAKCLIQAEDDEAAARCWRLGTVAFGGQIDKGSNN